MNARSSILIVTNTLYNFQNENDIVRAELSKQTIQNAQSLGYAILVVDGGSPKELLVEYKALGANVISWSFSGMGKGRRFTFKEALRTHYKVIVWTEPEKVDFIRSIEELSKPILLHDADMVIPKRNSLISYPISQQYNEPFMNNYIMKLVGQDLDTVFGPRVLHRDAVKYFLDYDGKYGDKWDAIFIPIFAALKDRKKVISVNIDYMHPAKQTKQEDSLIFYKKRLEQMNVILPAIEKFWNE